MIHIYSLICPVIFYIVKAELAPEQIQKEIQESNEKTKVAIQEAENLKKQIGALEESYKKYMLDLDATGLQLSEQETELLKKIVNLNITLSVLEVYIITEKKSLAAEQSYGYRLEFIKKLLNQEVEILISRRRNGDNEACNNFSRNKTAIETATEMEKAELAPRGFSGLPASLRRRVILTLRLNKVKLALSRALQNVQSLQEKYQKEKETAEKNMYRCEKMKEKFAYNIKAAEEGIATFEQDVKDKKAEEAFYHGEFLKERKENEKRIGEISKLKKHLAGFANDIECYKKLESEI